MVNYILRKAKNKVEYPLTIAQVSDYWSDIVTCRKFPV